MYRRTSTPRRYILFTWSRCPKCRELEMYLEEPEYENIARVLEHQSLDDLSDDSPLMKIFRNCANNGNNSSIPALAVIQGNALVDFAVGINPVMKKLGMT